jgi:hypothetical protein
MFSACDNIKPSCDWIYHSECNQREGVLSGVMRVNGPTRSTQTITLGSDSAILGGSNPYFLRSCFVSWQTGQVEHKRSTSCVRPNHVRVLLIVFSVRVCPGWNKIYHASYLKLNYNWLKWHGSYGSIVLLYVWDDPYHVNPSFFSVSETCISVNSKQ